MFSAINKSLTYSLLFLKLAIAVYVVSLIYNELYCMEITVFRFS